MNTQPEKFFADFSESKSNTADATDEQWQIGFLCYGARCGLCFDDFNISKNIKRLLPPYHELIDFDPNGQIYRLVTKAEEDLNGLYLNGELIHRIKDFSEDIFDSIQSKIQMSLAVILPPEMYLLHAGAVVFEKVGILIPGDSFSGKTTLTREFLRAGAEYYSDDCAVIDKNGNLYPYSKTLSVRNFRQESEIVEAEKMGAVLGRQPRPVRLIILAEYEDKQIWQSHRVSQGEAVWEISKNLFYPTSMTLYPAETLRTLANLATCATTLRGVRGEASETVEKILGEFF